MSQLTKKAITASFIKLINQMPFEKITVKAISEDCGINRNTFYYHYQDIYTLLESIFEAENQKILESNIENEAWQDAFIETCSFALENKRGIYNIYNSVSRRQVDRYLSNAAGKIVREMLRKQADTMNHVSEQDLQIITDFYQSALAGLVISWLDGGMKNDPEYVINRLGVLLDGSMALTLRNSQKH